MQKNEFINPATINALAFAGGGARCIGEVGALEVIEAHIDMSKVRHLIGTSGGAIVAMLRAVGYSPTEIIDALATTPLTSFLEDTELHQKLNDDLLAIQDKVKQGNMLGALNKALKSAPAVLRRLHQREGMNGPDRFIEWATVMVNRKIGKADNYVFTLNELYQLHKQYPQQFRLLYVIAFDNTANRKVILSHVKYGSTAVVDAVYASMAFPGLFEPAQLREKIGQFVRLANNGHVYSDGGVIQNLGVDVLDEPLGRKKVIKNPTLGIRMRSHAPAKSDLISEVFEKQEAQYRKKREYLRCVEVDDLGVSVTDLRLSDRQRNAVLLSGRTCAAAFFSGGLSARDKAMLQELRHIVHAARMGNPRAERTNSLTNPDMMKRR